MNTSPNKGKTMQTDVADAAFLLKDCSPEKLREILSRTDEQSRDRILHGIALVREHGTTAFHFGLSLEDQVQLPVEGLGLSS